ncbi:MAG: ferritin family protein [Flexilinea sp.]
MIKQWDGTEFIKMMVENEKAVGTLYRQLAGDSKFGAKFFENLARDEDRHYNIYTALLNKYAGSKDLTIDVSEEYEKYLNLLVGNNMLINADKLLEKAAKATNKDEIYDLAERSERDSVLFVEELINIYPDLQPEDFHIVLKEEKNHLSQVMSRRMESQLKTLRL